MPERADGEAVIGKIAGYCRDQSAGHCAAFGPVVKDQVAALSRQLADKVLAGGEGFILTGGMAPARLVGTGRYQIALDVAWIRIPLFNGHDCG